MKGKKPHEVLMLASRFHDDNTCTLTLTKCHILCAALVSGFREIHSHAEQLAKQKYPNMCAAVFFP